LAKDVETNQTNYMITTSNSIWDASECVLVLIDYQQGVFDIVYEQDHRVIELNVCTLAKAAIAFNIPVVLSTLGVKLGVNTSTIQSLKSLLPGVIEIDRSSMNAWEDADFVSAIEATGRKKLVICGIVTSTCLAFAGLMAMDDGYEVMFIEDATGDQYKRKHEMAIERLIQAGAIPNTTIAMIAEWFRDWRSPFAAFAGKLFVSYFDEIAPLKTMPETYSYRGLASN
jgi:nicotinamidase-related amidase